MAFTHWLRRGATVAVAAPTAIAALKSTWGSALMLHALHLAAAVEYSKLLGSKATGCGRTLFLVATMTVGASSHGGANAVGAVYVLVAAVLVCSHLLQMFPKDPSSDTFRDLLVDTAGVTYLGLGFSHMLLLRNSGENGPGHCLFLVLCVWQTDNGALFAGSLSRAVFGGDVLESLVPRRAALSLAALSPSKTWAGVVGGLVFGTGTAFALASVMVWPTTLEAAVQPWGAGQHCERLLLSAPVPCWPWACWAWLGFAVAILAICGDLVESALKRHVGAKDSGSLFPGHGGCLDRLDSLLLSVPFYYHASRVILGS